ncbi:hypothetical protein B0H11DRAFT_2215022 [Mycena galericulata]|nr:hypothetical protein B0H11DRAFT_2215022 [Mycena galericulata]
MDYEAYATAITDELRGWVHMWLAGVRISWVLHAALGLPLPHPNFPLPRAFPFNPFCVWEIFEWVHEYGSDLQIRHSYVVSFAFHGRTRGAGSSAAWKIVCGDIELGVFEIAGSLYDDRAQFPLVLGAELILDALLVSLTSRRPVRLASYVVWPLDHAATDTRGAVRLFELRTPEELIQRLAARAVD